MQNWNIRSIQHLDILPLKLFESIIRPQKVVSQALKTKTLSILHTVYESNNQCNRTAHDNRQTTMHRQLTSRNTKHVRLKRLQEKMLNPCNTCTLTFQSSIWIPKSPLGHAQEKTARMTENCQNISNREWQCKLLVKCKILCYVHQTPTRLRHFLKHWIQRVFLQVAHSTTRHTGKYLKSGRH